MKIRVEVKMAAALLEPGDVIVMYAADQEAGLSVVTGKMRELLDGTAIETTYGRVFIGPDDMATLRAAGAFREMGTEGARKMTYGALLEPTPLLVDGVVTGMDRAARAYMTRVKTEAGFLTDARCGIISAVLWHYGRGGMEPGQFRRSLFVALDNADQSNFARLAVGFPDEALAVWLVKNVEDAADELAAAVEERLDTTPVQAVVTIRPVGNKACADASSHDGHLWEFQGASTWCMGAVAK